MWEDLHKIVLIVPALCPDCRASLPNTQWPKLFKRNILFPPLKEKFNATDPITLIVLNTVFLLMKGKQ